MNGSRKFAPWRGGLISVLAVLWLFACAAAPVQEMSDARQAIAAAEEAGADAGAPNNLARAQSLLASAEEKLQRRDYKGARFDALSAHDLAVAALKAARPQSAAPN